MGIFDAFTGKAADDAAQAQMSAYKDAYADAIPLLNQGSNLLKQYYAPGINAFKSNVATADRGTQQLGNMLGLNGPAGNQMALQTLQSTPGYEFALTQGAQNVDRNAAAGGNLASGNTLLDLQKQGQGLANQTSGQLISQLSPYLGYSTQGATGLGTFGSGLGQQLNQNKMNQTGLEWQSALGVGNAIANGTLGAAAGEGQLVGMGANLLGSVLGGLSGGGGSLLGSLGSGLSGMFGGGGPSSSNMAAYYTTPGLI